MLATPHVPLSGPSCSNHQPALYGIPLWESYNHRLSPDHGIILSLFCHCFSVCFSCFFLFHIILRSCELDIFMFFILQSCASVIFINLFIVFPSCAININWLSCSYLFIFFARCHHVLVIQHRKWIESKSETEKIIYTKWEIKWKLRKKRQQKWKKKTYIIYLTPYKKMKTTTQKKKWKWKIKWKRKSKEKMNN